MDPETIAAIALVKDLVLTIILIIVLLKIANGHQTLGNAVEGLRFLVQNKWRNAQQTGLQERAYMALFAEFIASNPHFTSSTQSVKEKEFALWLHERYKQKEG